MFRTCRTTRLLITVGLTFSLGLSGLLPQTVALSSGSMRNSLDEQPAECCCGTIDGRCCGMGCCSVQRTPQKDQQPCPNRRENHDWRSNPFAVVASNSLFEHGNNRSSSQFGDPFSDTDHSLADSSLQARHVRIDA